MKRLTCHVVFYVVVAALAGCSELSLGPDAGENGNPDAAVGLPATFTALYGDYLSNCAHCHAPGAPGRTSDIEQSLNFATKDMAYMSIKTGSASGLMGNFSDCNGVAFLAATPAQSLLLAALDQPTRQAFDLPTHASCDGDTISDETVKVGRAPSAAFLAALKSWIQAGAPNN